MSQEMFLEFPAEVDKDKILAVLSHLVGKRGVVATHPDDHEEPDPDEYVRPGFEDVDRVDEDQDDSFTRYLGIRRGKRRYRWMELNFSFVGGQWCTLVELRDLDEEQMLLVGNLVELLGVETE